MKLNTILGPDGDAPATRLDIILVLLALLLGWQARGAWDNHVNEGADKRIVAALCYGIKAGLLTVDREVQGDRDPEKPVTAAGDSDSISAGSEWEKPPSCENPPPEE